MDYVLILIGVASCLFAPPIAYRIYKGLKL